ncbi:Metal tolerance protein A2 [Vitis vinifera]|nr:Metal tolerance protein A2 [Vitis vinifera]
MLEKGLCEMDEVVAVHELHIWAITVGKVLLACHVKVRPEANTDMVLDNIGRYWRQFRSFQAYNLYVILLPPMASLFPGRSHCHGVKVIMALTTAIIMLRGGLALSLQNAHEMVFGSSLGKHPFGCC